MGIDELQRWHWIVIGALVGAALMFTSTLSSSEIDRVQSSDAIDFERDVIYRDEPSGKPLVTGITIHPPQYSPVVDGQINLVTYKRLAKDRSGRRWWKEKFFVAAIPYVPAISGRVAAAPGMTINQYLAELSRQHSFIGYRYGWWMTTSRAIMVGAVGGVVLIGLVWPTLLNLMLGAGLGRQREPSPNFSLWNYKPRAAGKAKSRPTVTAADQQRVQDVTDAYARSLQPTGSAAPSHSAAAATATEVKQLNTSPTEDAPRPEGEVDDIEVKDREYYPVIVHHKKQSHGENEPGPPKPRP